MTTIRQLQDGDYVQLADLFDSHISALQPGWGVRARGLRERLSQKADPEEETRTIVVVDGGAFCAASHIRRFADDEGQEAEIVWVVSWPNREEALDLLLEHILDSLSALPPKSILLSQEVYVPVFVGMCDPWPHLRSAIRKAGFTHLPRQNEAAYAGPIHLVEKLDPPVPEVQLRGILESSVPASELHWGTTPYLSASAVSGFPSSSPSQQCGVGLSCLRSGLTASGDRRVLESGLFRVP